MNQTTDDKAQLTPRDYQDAIDVQNACNLSGVVFSFARVMQRICNDRTLGTAERNTHPIAVMYSSKIADLTRSEYSFENFSKACDACETAAKGGAQ